MGLANIAFNLAAATRAAFQASASFFNTAVLMRSDTPVPTRIFVNGIASQYYRIFNYCLDDVPAGSGSFGQGILQIKWSNDSKAIVDIIAKSRATTIGGTPVALQAGDQIYSQAWYGDCGPTVGDPAGSMGHIGQFKVAMDGAPTGDSTELPGYISWYTGTGFHTPGSRIALEINSRQQIHAPGPFSNPFGPTGASWGANFVLGIGATTAGGAPWKFTLVSTALLAIPEAGAFEPDATGILFITNSAGKRRQIIDADTANPTILPGTGAGTGPTIAIAAGPNSGRITLTTGSAPTLGGVIATVTYANAFPNDSFVVLSAADPNSALGIRSIYANGTASGFTINNASTALNATTNFIWNYQIIGK